MAKKVLSLMAILALVGAVLGPGIFAAETANVTATVTVQNVAITVEDGNIAYGILVAGGTKDTTTHGVDDSQTATNTGNVTEDFSIRGFDVSTGCSWTLANTQGTETYFHKFCTANCDSSPTWTALTTSYQTLASGVAVGGTQVFDLQIGVPTSTTCTVQATVTVTVLAAATS